jgi:hypothetical protein
VTIEMANPIVQIINGNEQHVGARLRIGTADDSRENTNGGENDP